MDNVNVKVIMKDPTPMTPAKTVTFQAALPAKLSIVSHLNNVLIVQILQRLYMTDHATVLLDCI